jgi:hypothetical protein
MIPFTILQNMYLKQKSIGDEHSYILDRTLQNKHQGNSLSRPFLLLNEKFRQDTQNDVEPTLQKGQAYEGGTGAVCGSAGPGGGFGYGGPVRARAECVMSADSCSDKSQPLLNNLEFLSEPSCIFYNLKPDEHGVVSIESSKINQYHSQLIVIAVDGLSTAYRNIGIDSIIKKNNEINKKTFPFNHSFNDIRLLKSYNCEQHFIEQHLIKKLYTDEKLIIDDIKNTTIEIYESLSDIYNYCRTVSKDDTNKVMLLNKFEFLLSWNTLDEEVKGMKQFLYKYRYNCTCLSFFLSSNLICFVYIFLILSFSLFDTDYGSVYIFLISLLLENKYSEFSCHEFNYFIYKKDITFFKRVISPYLKNKLIKTFLDEYLLEINLESWLNPIKYQTLNLFEMILLSERISTIKTNILLNFQQQLSLQSKDRQSFINLFKIAIQCHSLQKSDDENLIPKTTRADMKKKARRSKRDSDESDDDRACEKECEPMDLCISTACAPPPPPQARKMFAAYEIKIYI